jgi:CheY-like chemotaxis protein
LAGGVAHDFNNILTVIGGCTSELAGLVGHGQARELLLELNAAVDRASSLTRQLLAFSRQQVVELKAIDLNAVVRDAERMLGRLLGEDITLHVKLGSDLGRVKADATYLTQVLMNLTVNARDALPKGGHLSIETRNVNVDRAFCAQHPGIEPGPCVLLVVADNGAGMSDEVKARAFEPFFSTKGVGKGTGLGLSVTHGIIQQFGGVIELSSQLQVGTEVAIYFPTLTQEQTKALSGRAPAPPGKETILLVEDDPGVRRVSVRILKAAGYTVIEARDGMHALEVFAAHANEIDLMVTDVVMPEMDGRHLAEKIHAQRPELKVLYLSGYTDDAIVRYGISHAEMAFLQKPFSPSGLTDKVREILDQKPGPAS